MCILVLLGYTLAICACIYFIIFMRLLRHISLLFALMLFVGCSTDEHTAELIDRAERIVEEHPDSALTIMRSIDPETIYGDRDMAHYRLVYSEALYHSKIDSDNDSLTRPLFDYYLNSDNHSERARAMYQHALVMYNGGKYAEAMYSLLEAEKSLEHIDNPRLAGLVHRTKGDIYGEEYMFGNSIDEMQIAVEYFDEAGLAAHRAYSQYEIGDVALRRREHDFALEQLNLALPCAIETENVYLLNNILVDLAYLYVDLEDYAMAEEFLADIDISYISDYQTVIYYCLKSVLSSYNGDYEMAEWYIHQCDGCDAHSLSLVYYAQMMMHKFNGDYERAFAAFNKMKKAQDSVVLSSLSNPILNREIEFLKRDIEQTDKENRLNRIKSILIISLCILIIIVITILLYVRNKRYRKEIASYISTLSELELLRSDSNQVSQYNHAIALLYQDHMEQINQLCEVYYSHSKSSRQARKVYDHVHSMVTDLTNDVERLAQLEGLVNSAMDNIMQKLREQCPTLTEREFRVVLYTYAGFSNVAICLFVGCNSETLPKIKYKIRERIKQSNSPDFEQLLNLLYKNKH